MILLYIDCHAHLFFSPIPENVINEAITGEKPISTIEFINKMISNANSRGVTHIVGVLSDPTQFFCYQQQLKIKNIVNVIGISRNHATKDQKALMTQLQEEINQNLPHGIGEIGLDYHYGISKLTENEKNIVIKKQQQLLKTQIQLAREYNIPIVIHAGYKTDKDIVKILTEEKANDVGAQIHGYLSEEVYVSELLDMGFYFSFGYFHPREEELRRIVELVPLEKLLTETDAPYHLMDNPKKFILPEDIVSICKDIADIKNIDLKNFTRQVFKNARNLFNF